MIPWPVPDFFREGLAISIENLETFHQRPGFQNFDQVGCNFFFQFNGGVNLLSFVNAVKILKCFEYVIYFVCFLHRFNALVSKDSGLFCGRLSTIYSKSGIKLYLRE